jgi:hypothetical protein
VKGWGGGAAHVGWGWHIPLEPLAGASAGGTRWLERVLAYIRVPHIAIQAVCQISDTVISCALRNNSLNSSSAVHKLPLREIRAKNGEDLGLRPVAHACPILAATRRLKGIGSPMALSETIYMHIISVVMLFRWVSCLRTRRECVFDHYRSRLPI